MARYSNTSKEKSTSTKLRQNSINKYNTTIYDKVLEVDNDEKADNNSG